MKKILFIIVTLLFIISCDKIEKPYKVEKPKLLISVDTPDFPIVNNYIQKILLEEYTGHKCNNCPEGHEIVAKMQKVMQDTLVVLAIHATKQAEPDNNTIFSNDYRTETGNNYSQVFGITSLPKATINRKQFNGNFGIDRGEWNNSVANFQGKKPSVGIQIIPIFNNPQDTAFVFVKVAEIETLKSNLRLCVLLSEDDIVSPQLTGKGVDSLYTHNHMLRANISPIWGTDLISLYSNGYELLAYALPISSKWNVANCHVVAFVYDADTYEVLQVETTNLK